MSKLDSVMTMSISSFGDMGVLIRVFDGCDSAGMHALR